MRSQSHGFPWAAMRSLGDLLAIWVSTSALLLLIALVPESPVRVVLGLPFVLFFPGYALISALCPRQDDLDWVERLALGLGLSVAVVPLIGLGLNYTPWGIRFTPIVISLTLFMVVCSSGAMWRRLQLTPSERFTASRTLFNALPPVRWPAVGGGAVIIGLALFLSLRFGVLGGKTSEPFTEFYVLGPAGRAEGYPRLLLAGRTADVILGVFNHEGRPAQYAIQIRDGTDLLGSVDSIDLGPEGKWEGRVTFSPRRPADRVKIQFLLFNKGSTMPYHSLHLWMKVRSL